MANVTVIFTDTVGLTLYAFPTNQSLANWTTYRVLVTALSAPNAGKYSVVLDDTVEEYRVFSGASQPADWAVARAYVLNPDVVTTAEISSAVGDAVQDAFDAAGSAITIVNLTPVAATGQITGPIIIGNDYLADHSLAFEWTITEIDGLLVDDATCHFGGKKDQYNSWNITGTITDNDDGTWNLSFDLAAADTADLEEGFYAWSVEVRDDDDHRMTRILSASPVKLVKDYTPVVA